MQLPLEAPPRGLLYVVRLYRKGMDESQIAPNWKYSTLHRVYMSAYNILYDSIISHIV